MRWIYFLNWNYKQVHECRPFGILSGVGGLSFPGDKLPRLPSEVLYEGIGYYQMSLTGHFKDCPYNFGHPTLDFVNWIGLNSVKIINRKGTG